MKPVIRVENLSKQYSIGTFKNPYGTLRESLARAVRAPFYRIHHVWQSSLALLQNTNYDQAVGPTSKRIWALKDVNFEIQPSEVVGIVGRNGAGKSTLLKILSRITEPTTGRAELYGRVGSLLEVGTGFHPELTGRENIYLNGAILGMRREQVRRTLDNIVDFSGVKEFLDTPIKRYSSGMLVRLAFAVAAHLEPDILVVDEVLAVGDAEFQKRCLGKMRDVARSGRTILLVSHNMGAIRNMCTRALLIHNGTVAMSGGVDAVAQEYISRTYSNSQGNDTSAFEQTIATGDGFQITAFEARASDGVGGPPCSAGPAEFVLEYRMEMGASVPRLYAGIAVRDLLGTPLFFCSTHMSNSDIYGAPPTGLLICRVNSMPLIPGRYIADIKLIDQRRNVGYIAGTASFDVADSGRSGFSAYAGPHMGCILVPHCWELESAPAFKLGL